MNRISPRHFIALVSIQIGFAFNYIFSKFVMRSLPPLLWANIRTLFTALFLISFLFFRRQLEWNSAWKDRKTLLLFSLLGVVINQATFLVGLKLTTTANSSLINTTIPIFTLLWVTLKGHERFSARNGLGFVLAVCGVLILQNWKEFSFSSGTSKGDGLTLLNALSYSFFLFLSPSYFRKHDPVWITAWMFMFGSVFLMFSCLPDWVAFDWQSLDLHTVLSIVGGIFIGTVIPYLLIGYVLQTVSSALVAQFVYLQTLFAVALGTSLLGEKLHSATVAAGFLIFMGLYFSVMARKE